MCGASLRVGAPRVSVGLSSRVDAAGKPACELCGRRLSKVKHHRPYGAGRACQKHALPEKPPSSVTVALPSAPLRSHKRKAASDPGEFVAPPPLPLHQLPLFPSHAWNIQESNRRSRATAKSWHELATSSELKLWDEKRTKYWQHDCRLQLTCSFEDEKRVRLLSGSESIARDVLSAAWRRRIPTFAAAIEEGEGLQDVHYDVPVYSVAITTSAVLIYLTDTVSTAF